jgi:hypothetical protein
MACGSPGEALRKTGAAAGILPDAVRSGGPALTSPAQPLLRADSRTRTTPLVSHISSAISPPVTGRGVEKPSRPHRARVEWRQERGRNRSVLECAAVSCCVERIAVEARCGRLPIALTLTEQAPRNSEA